MPDPVTAITVGNLVAIAITEAIKAGVGETIKGAYGDLRAKIAKWCGGDVEALEKNPASRQRQDMIAYEIDQLSPDDKAAIKALALALSDALEKAKGRALLQSISVN